MTDHKHAMPALGAGATDAAAGNHSHAGAGHTIQDDDTDKTQRAKLSFQDGFAVTDDAGGDQTEVDLAYQVTPSTQAFGDAAAAGAAVEVARGDHKHAMPANPNTTIATDPVWDAAGDIALGTGADTGGKLAISVPAANILNVLGVVNGESTVSWKPVHDATAPSTQALGDAAAAGTALTAAHRDHKHAMPAATITDVVNDTTPQLGGDLDLNEKYVVLKQAPNADHTGSGTIVSMTAGETLVAGDVVYFKSDGKVWKADADAAGCFPAIGISLSGVNADAAANILLHGIFRDDTYTWTVGGVLYLADTPGAMTHTAPSTATDVVQVVGVAIHADRVLFNPSYNMVVVA
jgi:hypothetical protein